MPPRITTPTKSHAPYSHSTTREDDEIGHHGHFTRRIQQAHIHVELGGKTHQMDPCNEATYPGEHIENIEVILDHHNVRGGVKCRLFTTIMRNNVITWYKSIQRESITDRTLSFFILLHHRGNRRLWQPHKPSFKEKMSLFTIISRVYTKKLFKFKERAKVLSCIYLKDISALEPIFKKL
jgi:hypothetical protein